MQFVSSLTDGHCCTHAYLEVSKFALGMSGMLCAEWGVMPVGGSPCCDWHERVSLKTLQS
jgi:hypothetical protein